MNALDQKALEVANCCNCGRIIDKREKAEGGDGFGVQLDDERWACSDECWSIIAEEPCGSRLAVAEAVEPVSEEQVEAAARVLAERAFARVSTADKPTARRITDRGWILYADDARAALTAALSPDIQGDGCTCQACQRQFTGDLLVPDDVWAKIAPRPVDGSKGGGLLCGACIVDRIVAAGLATAVHASPSLTGEE